MDEPRSLDDHRTKALASVRTGELSLHQIFWSPAPRVRRLRVVDVVDAILTRTAVGLDPEALMTVFDVAPDATLADLTALQRDQFVTGFNDNPAPLRR